VRIPREVEWKAEQERGRVGVGEEIGKSMRLSRDQTAKRPLLSLGYFGCSMGFVVFV
jgi:hypothetical protein